VALPLHSVSHLLQDKALVSASHLRWVSLLSDSRLLDNLLSLLSPPLDSLLSLLYPPLAKHQSQHSAKLAPLVNKTIPVPSAQQQHNPAVSHKQHNSPRQASGNPQPSAQPQRNPAASHKQHNNQQQQASANPQPSAQQQQQPNRIPSPDPPWANASNKRVPSEPLQTPLPSSSKSTPSAPPLNLHNLLSDSPPKLPLPLNLASGSPKARQRQIQIFS
jgi:hypothetical protein